MPAIMAAVVSIIFCAISPGAYVLDETKVNWIHQLYSLLITLGVAIGTGTRKLKIRRPRSGLLIGPLRGPRPLLVLVGPLRGPRKRN